MRSSIQKVNIIAISTCLSLFSVDGKMEFPNYGLFMSPKIVFILVNNSSVSSLFVKVPIKWYLIHRGSNMSAPVFLNLFNELWKRNKMRGLLSILSLFCNKFYKFKNTGARMLGFISYDD